MLTYIAPTVSEVTKCSKDAGYTLSKKEIDYQHEVANSMFDSLNSLRNYQISSVITPRDIGEKPNSKANSCNQWAWKCNLQTSATGRLANMNVGVKDCIAVAGIPMQIGCEGLEGYIPTYDSPIVSQLLGEGAIISGKTNCENMCFSAASHTSCNGPVLNPHNRKKSAGGSSSGSAVCVALGEVKMAIGTDTGGSVRVPASYCGVVGMKPTMGLLPTKGVSPCLPSFDSVGPITKTIKDNALFLEIMAQANDNLQPILNLNYQKCLEKGIANINIGILREGFEISNPEISNIVKLCIEKLRTLGANVTEISIPEANLGTHILLANQYQVTQWLKDKLCPRGQKNLRYEIKQFFSDQNKLSPYAKAGTLLWLYLTNEEADNILEKSDDIANVLKQKFNKYLRNFDAICVPTVPEKAINIPTREGSYAEMYPAVVSALTNASLANITGHPALTINCGYTSDSMPVGIMFTSNYFDEGTLYRIGKCVEEL